MERSIEGGGGGVSAACSGLVVRGGNGAASEALVAAMPWRALVSCALTVTSFVLACVRRTGAVEDRSSSARPSPPPLQALTQCPIAQSTSVASPAVWS